MSLGLGRNLSTDPVLVKFSKLLLDTVNSLSNDQLEEFLRRHKESPAGQRHQLLAQCTQLVTSDLNEQLIGELVELSRTNQVETCSLPSSKHQFIPLPFYDELSVILRPVVFHSSIPIDEKSARMRRITIPFRLTDDEINYLIGKRIQADSGSSVDVQLRFAADRPAVHGVDWLVDEFPPYLHVWLNTELIPLPGLHPIDINRPMDDQKRTPKAIKITSAIIKRLLQRSHLLTLVWADRPNTRWAVTVRLVRQVNVETLLNRLLNRKAVISRETGAKCLAAMFADDELSSNVLSTPIVCSLNCPLSLARMRTPVKSIHCNHVQCFDLSSFLSINHLKGHGEKPVWRCPLCDKHIPYESLRVDQLFVDILTDVEDTTEKIAFQPDGSILEFSSDDAVKMENLNNSNSNNNNSNGLSDVKGLIESSSSLPSSANLNSNSASQSTPILIDSDEEDDLNNDQQQQQQQQQQEQEQQKQVDQQTQVNGATETTDDRRLYQLPSSA